MGNLRRLLLLVLFFQGLALSAAETPGPYSKFSISGELLGPGFFGSLNFNFRPAPELALNTGVGYFAFGFIGADITSIQFPVFASYLLGGQDHFLELSGGGVLVLASSASSGGSSSVSKNVQDSGVLGLVGLGYRYWPWEGGFHFRLTAYLFFRQEVAFWPGMTLGYAF